MKNEANLLDLDDLEIEDIDISSIDMFDFKTSKQNAIKILSSIRNEQYDYRYASNELDYDSETWTMEYKPRQTYVNLYFSDIAQYFAFSNPDISDSIVDVIKCWAADLINDYSPRTANVYLLGLRRAIYSTHGFSKNMVDEFVLQMNDRVININGEEAILSERAIGRVIDSISSFYEYFPFENLTNYVESLDKIKLPSLEKKYRELPSAKDVYTFSFYIEKWHKDVLEGSVSENETLRFYPVFLWWKLTSIIPIRPSEFANLSRNCFVEVKGKKYIHLPRGKQTNHKKIQIPDKLFISDELYKNFKDYIDFTKDYGTTETLISYRSIKKGHKIENTSKINQNRTNYSVLKYLIYQFYSDVLVEKYGLSVKELNSDLTDNNRNLEFSINKMLRPVDSRHIAIISLMLQGYDKVEIARLAGHVNLNVQYDYYNHVRFWVDSEVKRLSEEFGMRQISSLDLLNFSSPEADEKYESLLLSSWNNKNKKQIYKLKLGYCCDEEMSCPVGFKPEFSGCYYCPFWSINQDELKNNSESIKQEISVASDSLRKVTNFLLNIHQNSSVGTTGDVDADSKFDLKNTANKVQSEIVNNVKLQQLRKILS